ncbi:MAG: isoamylase early set domain-containing protein [Gemmatimonadota bacterium]|nr:isoamylase early set domain-containing protein [Gemmatimonadota bacterium]
MLDDELEFDPTLEQVVAVARRPVAMDPTARRRLLVAVRAEARPSRGRARWAWLTDARSLRLSPVAGAALAAGLVGVGVLLGLDLGSPGAVADNRVGREDTPVVRDRDPVRDGVKFVLVAPQAARVSLVGDFNRWDPAATPMERTPTGGTWSVVVPLSAGRHEYAFVVDGKQWLPDPSAPLAPVDGFGAPNSVVLVRGSSS